MKINKNIPIPTDFSRGKWTSLLKLLKIGYSFKIPKMKHRARLYTAAQNIGIKILIRKDRLWRIK